MWSRWPGTDLEKLKLSVNVFQDVTATTMAFDASEISTLLIKNIKTTCVGGEKWFASSVSTRRLTFADLSGNCSFFRGYTYNPDYPRQDMYSQGESRRQILG